MNSEALLHLIVASLDSGKAEQVNPIPLANKSDLADYMLIASGTSARHVQALARRVIDRLAESGIKGIKPEGDGQDGWIVIDALDVIVHLFSPQQREFYDLDGMWRNLPGENAQWSLSGSV